MSVPPTEVCTPSRQLFPRPPLSRCSSVGDTRFDRDRRAQRADRPGNRCRSWVHFGGGPILLSIVLKLWMPSERFSVSRVRTIRSTTLVQRTLSQALTIHLSIVPPKDRAALLDWNITGPRGSLRFAAPGVLTCARFFPNLWRQRVSRCSRMALLLK